MARVDVRTDPLRPSAILLGWLVAALAAPTTLLLAVLGQGVGAVLGGSSWIGISTPWTRPPWALVNQPTVDFAASSGALGYWFGSSALLLAVAALGVPLLPRPRTLAAELAVVQLSWSAAFVGGCWLPLLDPDDGHPARWLALHDLPTQLVWAVPGAAALAAVPVVVHLLQLVRGARHHAGRGARLAAVTVHLVVPAATWIGLQRLLADGLRAAPAVAVALPAAVVVGLAWARYPRPHGGPLEPLSAGSFLRLTAIFAAGAILVVAAGRPLPGGTVSGLLWATPDPLNNVRPWIEPATPAEYFSRLAGGGR